MRVPVFLISLNRDLYLFSGLFKVPTFGCFDFSLMNTYFVLLISAHYFPFPTFFLLLFCHHWFYCLILIRGRDFSKCKIIYTSCLFLMDKFVRLISLILTPQFKTSGKYYEIVQIKVNYFFSPDYIFEDMFCMVEGIWSLITH